MNPTMSDIPPCLNAEDSRPQWVYEVHGSPPLVAVGIRRRGDTGGLRAVPTGRDSFFIQIGADIGATLLVSRSST